MIEGLAVVAVVMLGILALVGFVGYAIAKSETADALERHIAADEAKEASALLLTRGHLLRPDVRDAAKVWLLERENESAEKKG